MNLAFFVHGFEDDVIYVLRHKMSVDFEWPFWCCQKLLICNGYELFSVYGTTNANDRVKIVNICVILSSNYCYYSWYHITFYPIVDRLWGSWLLWFGFNNVIIYF